MSESNFSLKYQDREIIVTKNGGQVLSFKNKNQEILYQGSSPKRTGIPILFPFANPLQNNIFKPTGKEIGQHGFARNSQFEISQTSETVVELRLNNESISAEMQIAYPFKFELKIIIDLIKENTLIYKILVTNLDQKDLPIAPGLHPYFPIKHEHKSQLEISNLYLKNIDWQEPSNGYFYDWNDEAKINFGSRQVSIKEISDKKEFENLVLWSQIPTGNDDFDFVCIEQFTRKTNAINDNPILVKPGKTWSIQINFEVQK